MSSGPAWFNHTFWNRPNISYCCWFGIFCDALNHVSEMYWSPISIPSCVSLCVVWCCGVVLWCGVVVVSFFEEFQAIAPEPCFFLALLSP